MKNYIRNGQYSDLRTNVADDLSEDSSWDTSSALVRRTLVECIDIGRRFKQTDNKADAYQAFQLLGRALHTLCGHLIIACIRTDF